LRVNADSTLQANIDGEVTRASNAEATLQANILVEKTRALAAESTLNSAILAETSRAQSVEGSLSSLQTSAQSSIVAAINEIVGLVGNGTADVRLDYNNTIFTYQSATPATTHTITHNLASNFVDFGVMIKRADGSYYNDIVSVKVISNNEAEVYLATAQDIRVICRSAVTI
jgi:hypothetical protein